jgi:hypothetical protein
MVILCLVWYVMDDPREPPNGGTVLGYTTGTVAGLLIVFLSAFGIRKRTFSAFGTAIGWVSAHVYLGLAALILATLHCGLRFGWNEHTLTYVLMVFVTVSGIWGMYAYLRYPGVMSAQRGNQQRRATLSEIDDLDDQSRKIAVLSQQTSRLISEAIRRTDRGPTSLWASIAGRDESALLLGGGPSQPARLVANPGYKTLMEILAQLRLESRDAEQRSALQELLELSGKKSVLLGRLRRETQLAAVLRIWLWIHVPVCCALLAALIVHILTVFLY